MENFVVFSMFRHLIFVLRFKKEQLLWTKSPWPRKLKPWLRPALVSICLSIGLAQPIGITTWDWDSRIGV